MAGDIPEYGSVGKGPENSPKTYFEDFSKSLSLGQALYHHTTTPDPKKPRSFSPFHKGSGWWFERKQNKIQKTPVPYLREVS